MKKFVPELPLIDTLLDVLLLIIIKLCPTAKVVVSGNCIVCPPLPVKTCLKLLVLVNIVVPALIAVVEYPVLILLIIGSESVGPVPNTTEPVPVSSDKAAARPAESVNDAEPATGAVIDCHADPSQIYDCLAIIHILYISASIPIKDPLVPLYNTAGPVPTVVATEKSITCPELKVEHTIVAPVHG